MRRINIPLGICLVLSLSSSLLAQQTATSAPQSSPQALMLLQQSLAALTSGRSTADITLSGKARRIAGSDDENGTVTFKALSAGAARFDFSYPSGPHTEIRTFVNGGPAGSWTGPDGISHAVADHNLTNMAGIYPAFTLSGVMSLDNLALVLVGQEMKNNHSVYHVSVSQQFPELPPNTAALAKHLTQIDIYLDTKTFLPVEFDFDTHSDDDASLDIPVELLFLDYHVVQGAQVPFRIQKSVNYGLSLDLQFESGVINSGLSIDSLNK